MRAAKRIITWRNRDGWEATRTMLVRGFHGFDVCFSGDEIIVQINILFESAPKMEVAAVIPTC